MRQHVPHRRELNLPGRRAAPPGAKHSHKKSHGFKGGEKIKFRGGDGTKLL